MIDFHYKRNFQDLTEMLSLPIAFHFSIHFFHVNSQNPHAAHNPQSKTHDPQSAIRNPQPETNPHALFTAAVLFL